MFGACAAAAYTAIASISAASSGSSPAGSASPKSNGRAQEREQRLAVDLLDRVASGLVDVAHALEPDGDAERRQVAISTSIATYRGACARTAIGSTATLVLTDRPVQWHHHGYATDKQRSYWILTA